MILISACLCGVNCKYNGGNNLKDKIEEVLKNQDYMLICPEQLGGLSTPRNPAEIVKDKVIDKEGNDVTINFKNGALEVIKISNLVKAKYALLKEGSPSCGSNFIYDGNFNGTKISGEGLTTKLLKENGVEIFSDDEIDKLIKNLE